MEFWGEGISDYCGSFGFKRAAETISDETDEDCKQDRVASHETVVL